MSRQVLSHKHNIFKINLTFKNSKISINQPSIHPSIHIIIIIHPSNHLSFHLSSVHSSVHLLVSPSIHLSFIYNFNLLPEQSKPDVNHSWMLQTCTLLKLCLYRSAHTPELIMFTWLAAPGCPPDGSSKGGFYFSQDKNSLCSAITGHSDSFIQVSTCFISTSTTRV